MVSTSYEIDVAAGPMSILVPDHIGRLILHDQNRVEIVSNADHSPSIAAKLRIALGDHYDENAFGIEDMLAQISGLIYDLDTAVALLSTSVLPAPLPGRFLDLVTRYLG